MRRCFHGDSYRVLSISERNSSLFLSSFGKQPFEDRFIHQFACHSTLGEGGDSCSPKLEYLSMAESQFAVVRCKDDWSLANRREREGDREGDRELLRETDCHNKRRFSPSEGSKVHGIIEFTIWYAVLENTVLQFLISIGLFRQQEKIPKCTAVSKRICLCKYFEIHLISNSDPECVSMWSADSAPDDNFSSGASFSLGPTLFSLSVRTLPHSLLFGTSCDTLALNILHFFFFPSCQCDYSKEVL